MVFCGLPAATCLEVAVCGGGGRSFSSISLDVKSVLHRVRLAKTPLRPALSRLRKTLKKLSFMFVVKRPVKRVWVSLYTREGTTEKLTSANNTSTDRTQTSCGEKS
jgi:hypothetical protein